MKMVEKRDVIHYITLFYHGELVMQLEPSHLSRCRVTNGWISSESCVACRAPDGHFNPLNIQDTTEMHGGWNVDLASMFPVRRCSRRELRSGAALPVPTEMLKDVDNMRMRVRMHTCNRKNSILSKYISSPECCCELRP